MKGFSLHQPWAWALVYRDKVENRPMRPPANMIGQRFAIQAAKTWDPDAIQFMQERGIDLPALGPDPVYVHGAIIGVATLVRYVSTEAEVEALTPDEARWFVGQYGYIVDNRIPLKDPVPCRGMQGFFPLPTDVEKAVLAQLPVDVEKIVGNLQMFDPRLRVYDSTLPPKAVAAKSMPERGMQMVVIYDRPHDAPAGFVVRQWHVRKDGMILPGKLLGIDMATLETARASVPSGMVNIGRTDTDDAKIVEVWI